MIYLRYLRSLLLHKWFVFLGGLMVGGIPIWRLIVHDWTKFTPAEFGRYARNFHGDYSKSPNDRDQVKLEFAYAWLNHENRNPHHWGYWIPRSGKHEGRPLPMPQTYVREMVADWLGAGRAYTGKWDMTAWLNKDGSRAMEKMHIETQTAVKRVLLEQGYVEAIDLTLPALGRVGGFVWEKRNAD